MAQFAAAAADTTHTDQKSKVQKQKTSQRQLAAMARLADLAAHFTHRLGLN